jgi:hypothetical protein
LEPLPPSWAISQSSLCWTGVHYDDEVSKDSLDLLYIGKSGTKRLGERRKMGEVGSDFISNLRRSNSIKQVKSDDNGCLSLSEFLLRRKEIIMERKKEEKRRKVIEASTSNETEPSSKNGLSMNDSGSRDKKYDKDIERGGGKRKSNEKLKQIGKPSPSRSNGRKSRIHQWNTMSQEVMVHIFKNLEVKDLFRLSMVSKRERNILDEDGRIWKHVALSQWNKFARNGYRIVDSEINSNLIANGGVNIRKEDFLEKDEISTPDSIIHISRDGRMWKEVVGIGIWPQFALSLAVLMDRMCFYPTSSISHQSLTILVKSMDPIADNVKREVDVGDSEKERRREKKLKKTFYPDQSSNTFLSDVTTSYQHPISSLKASSSNEEGEEKEFDSERASNGDKPMVSSSSSSNLLSNERRGVKVVVLERVRVEERKNIDGSLIQSHYLIGSVNVIAHLEDEDMEENMEDLGVKGSGEGKLKMSGSSSTSNLASSSNNLGIRSSSSLLSVRTSSPSLKVNMRSRRPFPLLFGWNDPELENKEDLEEDDGVQDGNVIGRRRRRRQRLNEENEENRGFGPLNPLHGAHQPLADINDEDGDEEANRREIMRLAGEGYGRQGQHLPHHSHDVINRTIAAYERFKIPIPALFFQMPPRSASPCLRLDDLYFHPIVNLPLFASNRAVTFIPPISTPFQLARFRLNAHHGEGKQEKQENPSSPSHHSFSPPILINASVSIKSGQSMDYKILSPSTFQKKSSKSTSASSSSSISIKKYKISISLWISSEWDFSSTQVAFPIMITSNSPSSSRSSSPKQPKVIISQGSYKFISGGGNNGGSVMVWKLPKRSSGFVSLNATFSLPSSSNDHLFNPAMLYQQPLSLRYSIENGSLSNFKARYVMQLRSSSPSPLPCSIRNIIIGEHLYKTWPNEFIPPKR